jgi:uncharacterized membrane protein YvbJ
MAKKEAEPIITGEQIEKILDLCNQHNVFDLFFAPKESKLSEEDDRYLSQMFMRREKLKAEYIPDENELKAWKSYLKSEQSDAYTIKKYLMLNRDFTKSLFAEINPNTEFSIKNCYDVIIRGLERVKAETGL